MSLPVEVQSKLGLNFDYEFFKIIKKRFQEPETQIRNESDLEEIIKFCLDECMKHFNTVKTNQGQYFVGQELQNLDDYDEEDGLNMIELENNFQINLLNVLHRFKESFERINGQINTNQLNFYHYMSALISIYLDVSLDLNEKLTTYNVREFRRKSLKETLCMNTFFFIRLLRVLYL